MESQYKVCEVKLTYKSKIKASEREKILSAENAYKILLSVFDSETIQYKEFFKVILMNSFAMPPGEGSQSVQRVFQSHFNE